MNKIVVNGLTFYVRPDSSDEKAIAEVVTRKGYDRRDFKIEAGQRWLDLGANVGAFAILAASRGAKVLAVEPEPETVMLLKQNLIANRVSDRVEVVEGAVVPDRHPDQIVYLHVNSANRNYWRSSIVRPWQRGHRVPVRAISISSLLRKEQDCKMDIEGAEMSLLEALTERCWQRLVFEWSFDVDRSIPRFLAVRAKLLGLYDKVRHGGFDETAQSWGTSWFPPSRTVWCFD